jgi:hypothetical protein
MFTFYQQYLQTLSYSVAGGGSGYGAPTFTANEFGSSFGQTLTTTPTGYWFDAGVPWKVTNPLTGPSSGEQWLTTQKTSGKVTGSAKYALKYQHQYFLTMQPVNPPGTGTATPSSNWYNAGSKVTIKATAKTGYKFHSWTGNAAGYSGPSASTTLSMTAPITETANFGVLITITSSPTGLGYVTVDGVPVKTPYTYAWVVGDTHTITALSPVPCGTGCQYVFTGWSDSGVQSHTITVPGKATTYKATLQKQYYFTINVNPTRSGTVNVGSGWYNAGQKVIITATANPGHTFKSWKGTGNGSYTGTKISTTITMNSAITETANFS